MDVDEFWAGYAGQPYELIHGEAVQLLQKEYLHEVVTSRVMMCLDVFVGTHYLGEVLGGGTRFALDAHNLRSADVTFVSNQQLATITDPERYLPFAPELMVEVISSRFTSTEILHKANLFLDAGTRLVWIIDPQPKQIIVLMPDGNSIAINSNQSLTGYHVLPEFRIKAEDLFPPLDTYLKYPDHS
jgi:Uma2 family endonuclease